MTFFHIPTSGFLYYLFKAKSFVQLEWHLNGGLQSEHWGCELKRWFHVYKTSLTCRWDMLSPHRKALATFFAVTLTLALPETFLKSSVIQEKWHHQHELNDFLNNNLNIAVGELQKAWEEGHGLVSHNRKTTKDGKTKVLMSTLNLTNNTTYCKL